MLHDKKDKAKKLLIFWQPNFWVVAMKTNFLLYTGTDIVDHNN